MVKKAVNVLKYVLSIGLAIVLMYFAFKNVDFEEFWAKAKLVDYTWVFISIALSYMTYWLRAYRWNLLLRPLGYSHLTANRTTIAVLIGYLANLAFPRLGEVTRCGVLRRNEKVPVSISLGSVITERIIDVISLLILIFFTLAIEYDTLMGFFGDLMAGFQNIRGLMWKAGLALGGVLLIAAFIFYLGIRSGGRFREFVRQMLEGILSLRKVRNFPGFIVSTIFLWITYYFMSYVIVFSLPETSHLDWQAGVMLLVTSGIALAIPVQGGFGTYHTLVSGMLLLYGIEQTTGVFLATLLHTSQLIATAIFGGVAVLIMLFLKQKTADEPDQTQNSD